LITSLKKEKERISPREWRKKWKFCLGEKEEKGGRMTIKAHRKKQRHHHHFLGKKKRRKIDELIFPAERGKKKKRGPRHKLPTKKRKVKATKADIGEGRKKG